MDRTAPSTTLHLRDQNMNLSDIAAKPIITYAAKKGQHIQPPTA